MELPAITRVVRSPGGASQVLFRDNRQHLLRKRQNLLLREHLPENLPVVKIMGRVLVDFSLEKLEVVRDNRAEQRCPAAKTDLNHNLHLQVVGFFMIVVTLD